MGLKLETGKTYVDGYNQKVRIVCTDRKSMDGYSCIGLTESADQAHEYIGYYKPDGHMNGTCADLIREYDPLEALPVDTPVWVSDDPDGEWNARHYAGYKDERGRYVAFMDGKTSHSKGDDPMMVWDCMTNVNPNGKV